MKTLARSVLLVALSLLYFVVITPVGLLSRLVSDKLRLRRDPAATSYFRMAASAPPAERAGQSGVKQFTTRNS